MGVSAGVARGQRALVHAAVSMTGAMTGYLWE
jgi:hypothetical protein